MFKNVYMQIIGKLILISTPRHIHVDTRPQLAQGGHKAGQL